ncbi:MAG TPA: hypothetical protein PKH07_06720, partial [bacterium]|nr:hypothetical protein [bacterium]
MRLRRSEIPQLNRFFEGLLWCLAVAALLTLLFQYGFILTLSQQRLILYVDIAIVLAFVSEAFVKLLLSSSRKRFFRKRLADFILIFLFPILYFFIGRKSAIPIKMLILLSQLYLLGAIGLRALRLNKVIVRWRVSPAKLVVYSFV